MCRIAGIITVNTSIDYYSHVSLMCESMKHGGPDGKGIFQSEDKKVTIGNRRLALVDLSEKAGQPMQYEDIVITYNGEIYNHLMIKEELEAMGYIFRTQSDTEVILAAYKAWGTDSFVKLKGMFAFGLFDKALNSFFLVRGPLGIKPLYYSFIDGILCFASEVKAFAYTGIAYNEQPNWKVYFLAFGHIPEPYTTLEHVISLPKGHYLKLDLITGKKTISRYHKFEYQEKISKKVTAEKNVYDALRMSVRRHLLSDAPIGLFLSGGIDSSILALLADESTKYLTTVSFSFSEPTFSEKQYQRIISQKMLSKHSGHKLKFEEFRQNFDDALEALDQPSNDGINTWFISKYAKENNLKAVLSGIGADELFGGYASFRRTGIVSFLKILPDILLRMIARLPFNSTRRCYFLSYKSLVGEYLFLRGLYTPEVIAKLLNIPKKEVNKVLTGLKLEIPETFFVTEKARISWLEANLYLQNQLLKDTDSMSMRHGVEVRTPFLDIDFVQTCLHIKSRLRFDNKQKKSLLVGAFSEVLPKRIWARKKMGFTFPFATWLQKIDKVNDPRLYQDNAAAADLAQKFKSGKLSWAKMLVLYQISYEK